MRESVGTSDRVSAELSPFVSARYPCPACKAETKEHATHRGPDRVEVDSRLCTKCGAEWGADRFRAFA